MSESMSRAHPASETCCEIGVRCQGPGQGGAAQAFRGKRFGADSEFIIYHTARDKSDAYNWGLVLPGLGTGKDAQVGTAWELGSEVAQFMFLGWGSNPHPLTQACCAPSPVTPSGLVFLMGPGTHGLGVAQRGEHGLARVRPLPQDLSLVCASQALARGEIQFRMCRLRRPGHPGCDLLGQVLPAPHPRPTPPPHLGPAHPPCPQEGGAAGSGKRSEHVPPRAQGERRSQP